nr:MAG TPA: hypothetical protein [Caudoviricetes sp.]DAZ72889.1 MAG TPA: hypothetical protein [Caudoviricetes sp.]
MIYKFLVLILLIIHYPYKHPSLMFITVFENNAFLY